MRDLLARKVRVVDPVTGGAKEQSIVRHDLMPSGPLSFVAAVFGYGATKYDVHNWRRGYPWSLSSAALMRHLHAWLDGEDVDEESGLPHLAHAVAHCLFLMEFDAIHPDGDDRWRPPEPEPPPY